MYLWILGIGIDCYIYVYCIFWLCILICIVYIVRGRFIVWISIKLILFGFYNIYIVNYWGLYIYLVYRFIGN